MKKLTIALAILLALASVACFGSEEYGCFSEDSDERIPVLMYHSIKSDELYALLPSANPMIISESAFREQMRYLYENNFTPLTSAQLMDFLFYFGELPENPVVLTFDDGYLDNYLFAAPIMREFGMSGMMFLITAEIPESTPQMVIYPTPLMSWNELLAVTDVFELGSHTHDMHRFVGGSAILETASEAEIRADLRRSFEEPLTLLTGFVYPYGRYSNAAIAALQAEGVRFAFTTREAYVRRSSNPMLLPRFGVYPDTTIEEFSRIVRGLQ